MSEFFVGQKVVRIKRDYRSPPSPWNDIGDVTEVGCIYEIREVVTYNFIDLPNSTGLRFVGVNRVTQLRNMKGKVNTDVPWGADWYRPLAESKKEEKQTVSEPLSKGVDVFRQIAKDVTEGKKVEIS
jgi:hypothetical protein